MNPLGTRGRHRRGPGPGGRRLPRDDEATLADESEPHAGAARDERAAPGDDVAGRAASPRAWLRRSAVAALFVLVVTTPLWASASVARVLVDALVLVAVAELWSYLAGAAGVVALGIHGFAGAGAYALWFLSARHGLNPVLAVAGAGAVGLLLAIVVAPLVLRTPPVLAALVTWVVGELAAEIVTRTGRVGGDAASRVITPVVDLGATRDALVSWLAVVLGVGAVVVVYAHRRSRYGLSLVASADDPEVARGLDLPVASARRAVWCLAGVGAAMAGAIVHFRTGSVSPSAFDPARWTFPAVAVAGLGGVTTIEGPFVAAGVYVLADEVVHGHEAGFALAAALIGLIGLVWGPDGWWGWVRTRLPADPFPVRRRPSR
jgi:branched-chain amino acid transport system permease protein